MKIKSLAIIAVSTVLLLAGISVAGANPITVHTAATNDVTTIAAPPRRPPPPSHTLGHAPTPCPASASAVSVTAPLE